jgi:putative FmdB family regulatory protein
MPRYDYAPTSGLCKQCGGQFEVYQKITEDSLKHCPDCKKPVQRLISPVAVASGRFSTSNARVKELGMTKYVKAGDGAYEKVAGKGPQIIRKPSDD